MIFASSAFSKCSLYIWKFSVHILLKYSLKDFEYFLLACEMRQLCSSLGVLWHCLSLGLERKLTFASPVATAEFSKFADILSAAFTASSFRIWNSSTGIPSPLLTLFMTATAKSLQSCPTLCDPIDGSPPGSPIPGILQARTLEWVAISFSSAWKWKVKGKSLSRVLLFTTPWTEAYQAPTPKGFSRQEYWSGVPLPSLIRYLA